MLNIRSVIVRSGVACIVFQKRIGVAVKGLILFLSLCASVFGQGTSAQVNGAIRDATAL